MNYDIFISYKRRGASSATAAYLYELLKNKGYEVFFDRKEMRSGRFDEQILEHINNAKDIIVLLEDISLNSCFTGIEDFYKTDWFCKEIMHALSIEGKNIIPVLLNGYIMPEANALPSELQKLTLCNALSLDIAEANEFYEKHLVKERYLKAKPKNYALAFMDGPAVSYLLFYTDKLSYDICEFGVRLATVTNENDENHPYRLPINYSGEHRYQLCNNDTGEKQMVSVEIDTQKQKYVSVEWKEKESLWDAEIIINVFTEEETIINRYLPFANILFNGTTTHKPNYEKALYIYENSIKYLYSDDREKVKDKVKESINKLLSDNIDINIIFPWLVFAVQEAPSPESCDKLYQLWEERLAKLDIEVLKRLADFYYTNHKDMCKSKKLYESIIKLKGHDWDVEYRLEQLSKSK